MQKRRFFSLFLLVVVFQACGGEKPPPRAPAAEPAEQRAEIPPADPDAHPLCGRPIRSPDEVWPRIDEWYNYKVSPRDKVKVLANLNEKSYEGGDMGDHPIIWCLEYDGGRAWYTGLGHTHEVFQEPLFREHLLGGLMWAAGAVE